MTEEFDVNITEIPKAEFADHIQFGNKMLLSGILSGYAGPIKNVCEWFMSGPLQKRRDNWVQAIALRLVVMERYVKNFQWQRLKNNEEFLTIMAQASQIAMRTHQQEKLEALRSAVTNTAMGSGNDFGLEVMFLQFIDMFSIQHIQWLKYYHNFTKSKRPPGSEDLELLKQTASETEWNNAESARTQLRDVIVRDLQNRGLLKDLEPLSRLVGGFHNAVTDLGQRFLNYIDSEDFEGLAEGKPPKPKEKTPMEIISEQGANAMAVYRTTAHIDIPGHTVAKQVRYQALNGRKFEITVLERHGKFSFEVDELREGELLVYGSVITSGQPPAYNMQSGGTKSFWVGTGMRGGPQSTVEEAIQTAIILING